MYSARQMQGLAITLVVAILVIVTAQYLLNKFLNIMLIEKLVPFIKKWEGGLSRDPNDTAGKNPAPWSYNGQTGWHTNKGITYSTFAGNAKKLGYEASKENFFNMADELWLKILKGAYVNAFPVDKIAHLPRIQAVIITWAWGSGQAGAERFLANFQRDEMGIRDANITPDEIVQNFKKRINPLNEAIWFEKLCKRRLADMRKMPTWNAHGNGWTNRINDLRKNFA